MNNYKNKLDAAIRYCNENEVGPITCIRIDPENETLYIYTPQGKFHVSYEEDLDECWDIVS